MEEKNSWDRGPPVGLHYTVRFEVKITSRQCRVGA